MAKKVSLNDVAKAAQVSKTLASMVLNGKGKLNGISPVTEKKVKEIAAKLKYQPNVFARALRLGKSNMIGVIIPNISNVFYANLVRSIEDEAGIKGYTILTSSSDESEEKERKLLNTFLDKHVEGIILVSAMKSFDKITTIENYETPIVLADRTFYDANFSTVTVNNEKGMLRATEHLIENGHTEISIMSISPSYISTQLERISGFNKAMAKHEIPIKNEYVVEIPYNKIIKTIEKSIEKWQKKKNMPTAILAANNSIAKACLYCFKKYNINIPNDVSLISFDDIELFRITTPEITAVSQPISDIGTSAVSLLIEKIKDVEVFPRNISLSTSLKERESVLNLKK